MGFQNVTDMLNKIRPFKLSYVNIVVVCCTAPIHVECCVHGCLSTLVYTPPGNIIMQPEHLYLPLIVYMRHNPSAPRV